MTARRTRHAGSGFDPKPTQKNICKDCAGSEEISAFGFRNGRDCLYAVYVGTLEQFNH
jgi:hypothetical protein